LTADRLTLHLDDRLSEIARIAESVSSFCAARGVSDDAAYKINLALEELLTNTISYGFGDGKTHSIDIELRHDGDGVTVEIVDDGEPFDPNSLPTPDLGASIEDRRIGGLGVHFVKTVMDEVRYRRDGGRNRITLRKRLPPG